MYRPTRYAPWARAGRRLLVVVLVGAALAVAALLWWSGTSGGPGGAGSAAPVGLQDPAGEAGYLAPAVATPDPVASAVAWLHATGSVSYADAVPAAWTTRARPVVTDRLAAEYAHRIDGSPGAGWLGFVADQCVTVVTDVDGVISPEAPRTTEMVNVQVAGRLQTVCRRGDPERRPGQDIAATLILFRGSDGVWRVDRQLY